MVEVVAGNVNIKFHAVLFVDKLAVKGIHGIRWRYITVRIKVIFLSLLAVLLIGICTADDELEYIGFVTSETGDTGFNGVLILYNTEGYVIDPIGGDFTVEAYRDSDYQDKIFERSFEVPSSDWGIWGLKKFPAWHMPRIAYEDIGDNLPEYLYIRAIFKPTGTSEEFTDKTGV